MNHITITFLQRIQSEAPQNGYSALDLPQEQGVVILPRHYSPQEQRELLQQFITTLKPAPPARQTMNPVTVTPDHDCQVTVEERSQLFKFLSSS